MALMRQFAQRVNIMCNEAIDKSENGFLVGHKKMVLYHFTP
jgi:hypothetical protein